MRERSCYAAIAVILFLLVPAFASAGEAISIVSVSEPTLAPSVVRENDLVDVSFDIRVHNAKSQQGCRESVASGMSGFPACLYVLQWTLSWDGEWLSQDSQPLAAGFIPYFWNLYEPGSITTIEVDERVHVNTDPGEHELYLRANWVAGVPVSSMGGARPFSRAYQCGLEDYFHAPLVGCSYNGHDWEAAPVVDVDVQPPKPMLPEP